jgi:hypothetical protein
MGPRRRHATRAGRTRGRSGFLACVAASALLIGACGAPAPPSNGGGGNGSTTRTATDPVIITSPAPGAKVSGAVFFAVQVLDVEALSTLELRVGDAVVTPKFPGESPLRVFLIPRDHPAGPLTLSARVMHGGQPFTARSVVEVVPQPPSSALVGASGGVLGAAEASGSVSTVVIPPGTAPGASVTFETMTQAEVLAQTGVNYEALGVTFLGAQEIRSTAPTGDRVAMTSGGFGPMVQSGQVVVSYRIAPDMGRGVDELMVINSASVAPSGDIVSNPIALEQVSEVVVAGAAGVSQSSLVGQSSTTLAAGPPGTQLTFVVGGLNPYAVSGYAVRFRMGTTMVEVPALVGFTGDGRHYLLANVPDLPLGTATVELFSVATEAAFMTFAMPITASPAVADPKGLVDAAYAAVEAEIQKAVGEYAAFDVAVDLAPLAAAVAGERARYAARGAGDPELVDLARRLAGAGVGSASVEQARAAFDVVPHAGSSAMCYLKSYKYAFDKVLGNTTIQLPAQMPAMWKTINASSLEHLDDMSDLVAGTPYECDPIKEQLCEAGIGPGCGDDEVVYPEDLPNDPRPRPNPRPARPGSPGDWITGMGSIGPPGGPLGGSAGGGGGAGGSGLATSSGGGVPRLDAGRYVVRVTVGSQAWPFATEIGADGYFFLPALPRGITSTLHVVDRTTFAQCQLPVTGRSVDSASAVYVDLDACVGGVDPGSFTIAFVGNSAGQGVWHQPQSWDPPRVPNADDHVFVPFGYQQVDLNDLNVEVKSIRSLGTLRMSRADLRAEEDLDLAMVRVGHDATFSSGGTARLGGLQVVAPFTLPELYVSLDTIELLSGSRLTVDHEITISESLLINHGWLQGSGRTILAAGATGELRGSPGSFGGGTLADTHTLEVRGTFAWSTDGGSLALTHSAVLEVAPEGTLHLARVNSGSRAVQGAVAPRLVNHGRILSTAHGTNFEIPVENHGTVEVAEGAQLALGRTTARTDNYGVMTGAGTILSERFVGTNVQPFVHHEDAVLDVATLRLFSAQDGTKTLLHGQLGVRNLELLNGRYFLDQDVALERLVLHDGATQGSILVSSGAITVSDELRIGQGTLAGTGTTTLLSGGELGLLLDRARVIADTHTLVNQGDGVWAPGTALANRVTINADAVFRNEGTFVVRNDRPIVGGGTFRNFGTVRKEVAIGASDYCAVTFVAESGSQVILDGDGTILRTGSGC